MPPKRTNSRELKSSRTSGAHAYPKVRKGAEIIIKSNPSLRFSEDGRSLSFGSGLFILGNSEGLRTLADHFLWAAERIDEDGPYSDGDPDDHQHLSEIAPPNQRLSDELLITTGSFTKKHRQKILKSCGISSRSRLKGSPRELLRGALEFQINWAKKHPGTPAVRQAASELRKLIQGANRALARLENSAGLGRSPQRKRP